MAHSNRRQHHEISSWWSPESKDDASIEQPALHSLQEGENYLLMEKNEAMKHGLEICMVHGSKMDTRAWDRTATDVQRGGASPLLCIDVDATTQCIAVKDIRPASKSAADTLIEFFIARRKRGEKSPKANSDNDDDSNAARRSLDAASPHRSDSSGYTTDDERDEMEHKSTPRKSNGTAKDQGGNSAFDPPQVLPPRHLRILRDGDRILLRLPVPSDAADAPKRLVNFQYNHSRNTPTHPHHHCPKLVDPVNSKPRLLSVKSDVKSDCKKKFKANSTSAAEAPSDDGISVKVADNPRNNNHGKRKDAHEQRRAGKDWSAADSPEPSGPREGGSRNDNAEDNDDGMEEYSYLTGEIVMRDQDYISALTGDEGDRGGSGYDRGDGHDSGGHGRRGEKDDADSAKAVANVGRGSPAKCRRSGECKEVSFDAKFARGCEPEVDAEAGKDRKQEQQQQQQEEVFLTAPEHHEDEHSDHQSEGLLSQQSDPSQTQSLGANFWTKKTPNKNAEDSASLSGVEEAPDDDSTVGPDSPKKKTEGENVKLPSQVEINEDSPNRGFSQSTTNSPNKLGSQSDDEAYNAQTQFVGLPPQKCDNHSDDEVYGAETQFVGPAAITFGAVLDNGAGNKLEDSPMKSAKDNKDQKPSHRKEIASPAEEKMAGRVDIPMAKSSEKKLPAAKPKSPKRAAYENSRLLGDEALHRIQNGAIMTSSVGGANLSLSVLRGNTDRDLLTSIALQSIPKTLPEAAMSGEETTVVNDQGTKETPIAEPMPEVLDRNTQSPKVKVRSPDQNNDAIELNGSKRNLTGVDVKDSNNAPTIPAEVCFVGKEKERNNARGQTGRTSFATPRQRSRRKRDGSAATPLTEGEEKVRVMFTGIEISSKHRKMIHSIGAEVVDSLEQAATATHVIASDGKAKLRRTPKLMICICKTSNILSVDWLEQSAAQQKVLDPKDFLLFGDKAAEAAYNFSMKETLENGEEARRKGGVLAGYSVYICNGVADSNAPPLQALQLIIEAAGGEVLKSLSKKGDQHNTIVLTSDPSTSLQLSERGVEQVRTAGGRILTTSWLFHTIITQRFSLHVGSSHSPSEKPKSRSKRKVEAASPPSSRKRRSSRR